MAKTTIGITGLKNPTGNSPSTHNGFHSPSVGDRLPHIKTTETANNQ